MSCTVYAYAMYMNEVMLAACSHYVQLNLHVHVYCETMHPLSYKNVATQGRWPFI